MPRRFWLWLLACLRPAAPTRNRAEYTRGFLEGLQAACLMAEMKMKHHFRNAEDEQLDKEDQDRALNCSMVLGSLASNIKCAGASIHRGQLDPEKIAPANEAKGLPYWWATADGKGKN